MSDDDPLADRSERTDGDDSDDLNEVVESYDLGDVDRDDPGRLARLAAWILVRSGFVVESDDSDDPDPEPATDDGPGRLDSLTTALTTGRAKRIYAAIGVLAVAVLAFWYALETQGPLAAIVYALLFLFFATLFPVGINLLGAGTPNGIGKLHILLGAVAFDHHYLVQRDRGWEWCPGERGRVYIDDADGVGGEWHDVSGEEHYSMLGWRPFGILRYKDTATWADERVDSAAEKARPDREIDPSAGADSGPVTRGSFEAVKPNVISGLDGTWLLDLNRIFTNGVRKIGDVELVETAEEIIERGEVDDGTMSNLGPLVETFGGILLGIVAGYGYLFLMG